MFSFFLFFLQSEEILKVAINLHDIVWVPLIAQVPFYIICFRGTLHCKYLWNQKKKETPFNFCFISVGLHEIEHAFLLP